MNYSLAEHIIALSTERHCTDAASPYDGFNITHYCGDTAEHVKACRLQLCEQLGISDNSLFLPRQVHSAHIEEVTEESRVIVLLLVPYCSGMAAPLLPLLP